jgi:hypothetical protein
LKFVSGASRQFARGDATNILMAKMLEKLQFTVCTLGKDWSTEGLHNLLDGDSLSGELVLCGAGGVSVHRRGNKVLWWSVPDQAKGAHANRLKISISRG